MAPPTSTEKRELIRVEYNKRFLEDKDYELVSTKEVAKRAGVGTQVGQGVIMKLFMNITELI
jgi:hypothetical protein